MKREFKLLIVCFIAVCAAANSLYADEQSTSGPRPSLESLGIDFMKEGVPPTSPVVIAGVPDYNWTHGCGPTAVGNVVGYYDGQGYSDLITGDASTQTNDVNQAMASGGDANGPYPPGSERHYEDYARPEDASPTLLTDDYITAGRTAHTNDCIADFQDTSKSTRGNYYGWSWASDLGPSFVNYVNLRNASYNPTYVQYQYSAALWNTLVNEINNNRPMIFLVDYNGDGYTDHFVAVIGYDAPTNQYACRDSWQPADIRWETFRGMASGSPWGIWGAWSFNLGQLGEVIKWEQPPDTTPYGTDVRCDRRDNNLRVLADDFQCTTTGPITKVRLWGSWINDAKGQIQKIHLSIHSDDPVGMGGTDPTNTYSKPDYLLWSKDFNSPHFTETQFMDLTPEYEYWWDPITGYLQPPGDHKIWQYDITIDSNQFVQEGTPSQPIVYWLDAYVVLEPNSPADANFGWKTSIEHWNDDAVWSGNNGTIWNEMIYPPTHPKQGDSADLAFAIITGQTTEPNEPNIPNAKYIQRPDLTPNGIDIRFDDADGVTRHIADDFPCNTPGPITDVHFWGSWKNDLKCQITALVVSFYDDDPNLPYSKPKTLLWQHTYMAGEFTETLYRDLTPEYEWWWDPYFNDVNSNGDHQVWKYDINIDPRIAFRQQGTPTNPKVYWLELQAWLPEGQTYRFGWKTSREHWNDDAVFATGSNPPYTWNELMYPQGHPYCPNSVDMAFAITTGAEPNIPEDPNVKFEQLPDETETGVDIRCDRFDGILRNLADDFWCNQTGPIKDIHLWGSWLNDFKGNIKMFHLSIHSDIPAWQSPTGYSTPGPVLWQRDFMAGKFTETLYKNITPYYEWFYDPYTGIGNMPGDQQIWQYDFIIDANDGMFTQQGDPNNPKVYWLDVWALIDPNTSPPESQFGWKTSRDHFNDGAVYYNTSSWQKIYYPSGHPQQGHNVDMAFKITTAKECLKSTDPGYANWKILGKPKCWCYRRQCRGDGNGSSGLGKPVTTTDFLNFQAGYNKTVTQLKGVVDGAGVPAICGDYNHSAGLGKPVTTADFVIFQSYYNKPTTQVPQCSSRHINFWTN